jgi:hypothetical protein
MVPAQILRDIGLTAEDADAGVVVDEGIHGILAVVGSGRKLPDEWSVMVLSTEHCYGPKNP